MHTNVLRVVAIIFFLLFSSGLPAAATDDHYAWVLVETQYSNGSLTAGEWNPHPLGEFRPSRDFYQFRWFSAGRPGRPAERAIGVK